MGDVADDDNQNVRVMTRVRLFNQREIDISKGKKELLRSVVKMRGKTCAIVETYMDSRGFPCERERQAFDFDECFWSIPRAQEPQASMPYADQKYVYERSGLHGLNWALKGYNVCLFAYGQTGSGKTYSMLGCDSDPGISPQLIDDLFTRMKSNVGVKTSIELMFFEIYNENVQDLFNKKNSGNADFKAPRIRQHPTKGVFVDGLQRKEVKTADACKRYIERGSNERAAAETKMNSHSSRSHAVFQLQITQIDVLGGTQKSSQINLIDLAGSEKIKQSQATDMRLKEATNINRSLTTLRRVIDVLIENSKIKNPKNWKHAPYRESVLTYVLSDSLGGNSKTMMIATISPHEDNIEDTLNTLQYALRAKSIVCAAKVNEEQSKMVLDSMRDEIMKLRDQIDKGPADGGGNGESPEMNAEILAEIEMREAEVAKIEEANVELEGKLAKEQEAKQEIETEMAIQKRERFATAFRNAFLLSSQKKKEESSRVELDALRKEKRTMENDLIVTQEELETLKSEFAEHVRTSETKIDSLTKEISQKDNIVAQSKRQNGNLTDENRFLKSQNTGLTAELQSLKSLKEELEQRIVRMQDEVMSLTAAGEQARDEKRQMEEEHSDSVRSLNDDMENLRRRKDKYKLSCMEAKAKSDAVQAVVDAMKGDRHSFMAAIKAQQQVVEEQSSSVRRYAAERRDAERKSTNLERQASSRDEDLKVMNETLREYQSASTEFVYENHSIHRELERIRRQNNELRSTITTASLSPMRSMTPNRNTTNNRGLNASSPMNSTAMSPFSQSSNGGGGSVHRHRDPNSSIRR